METQFNLCSGLGVLALMISAGVACSDNAEPGGSAGGGGAKGGIGGVGGSVLKVDGIGGADGGVTSGGSGALGGRTGGSAGSSGAGGSSTLGSGGGAPVAGLSCTSRAAAGGLITNGSFVSGTDGWFAFAGGTLVSSATLGCFGAAAGVTDRTQTYQGPGQSLLDKVVNGETIGISGWVRIQGAPLAPVNMTVKIVVDGEEDQYLQLASTTARSDNWLLMSGTAALSWPKGKVPTELSVYFEGAPVGVDIYIDELSGIKRGPVGGVGTGNTDGSVSVTLDDTKKFQTIEGFGASAAWHMDVMVAHKEKVAIYDALFKDLGLDILRFRNRFGRTSSEGSGVTAEKEILERAKTSLGRNPKVLLTSWSPPAGIKANGTENCTASDATAHTCTLRKVEGRFDYAGFADYWLKSLSSYATAGITPTWISIQNEPDFSPDGWEGCVFEATESAAAPGYDVALKAVNEKLASLSTKPGFLGPEPLGIHYGKLAQYLAALDMSLLAGVDHHIYEMGDDKIWDWKDPGPDSFVDEMFGAALAAGSKPLFQTEFNTDEDKGNTGGFETAWLIHNSMAEEGTAAFLYWELFWDFKQSGVDKGLVSLNGDTWLKRDQYFSVKHFSYFTDPGYVRIAADSNLPGVRASAYQSPDGKRTVAVVLNVGTEIKTVKLGFGGIAPTDSEVWRTVYDGTAESRWTDQGKVSVDGSLTLPGKSIVTVVLTK